MKLPSILKRLATKSSRNLFPKERAGQPEPRYVLNESTVKGFILTGKLVDVRELQTGGQFVEKPLNQYSSRMAAPPFEEMVKAHVDDGDVAFALDLHTAVIAGRGFHIKAATPNLQDYVMDFAKEFGLGEFSEISVMETLGYGNSLYRYRDPTNFADVEWLPLSAWRAIHWGRDNKIQRYEFNAAQYSEQFISAEEIFHLRKRRINASPYGFGFIQPLVSDRLYWVLRDDQWKQRTRPAIMDIKPEMQDVGRKVLRRYIPRHFIKMSGADDSEVAQAKKDLKTLEPEQDIVTGAEAALAEMGKGVKAIDWESWEKLYRNEIITMMENPAIRIFTEPGFTKANADAALESVKMLLQGFATYMATQYTNVIIRAWYEKNPYYNANGEKVRWMDTKYEFVWGVPEKPEFTTDHLIKLGELSQSGFRAIKPTEFRRNLRNMTGLDLDADDNVEEEFLAIAKKRAEVLGPPPTGQKPPVAKDGQQDTDQQNEQQKQDQ